MPAHSTGRRCPKCALTKPKDAFDLSPTTKNTNRRFSYCRSCRETVLQQRADGCARIRPLEPRFWSKVRTGAADDCWEWIGAKKVGGYGTFFLHGRWVGAHRVSWQLQFGDIPAGMHVCHHCDNPSCVNPAHLFLDTATGNAADKVRKNRQLKGEAITGAKLTCDQVREIRAIFARGEMTKTQLGQAFSVDAGTIHFIVTGATWTHCGDQ